MVGTLLRKVFGSKNDRELKRIQPFIDQINQREAALTNLSLDDLRSQTTLFRERLAQGAPLESLIPDAFAVTREVSRRLLNMRHFDVQLIGGIVLHEGKIAEMKTGEGKTLVATLPVYLNSLVGKGVHVVTVNDYLAKRDAEWMGPLYQALGLSIGVIQHDMDDTARRQAYHADVTYGTNNEFGFDYLRDNMKFGRAEFVQRALHYAIVDEVDSILIDEARTPLIISGPAEESTDKYYQADRLIPRLHNESDYTIDEKMRSVALTEEGVAKTERLLAVDNLYDPTHLETLHHLTQALKAHTLFKKDVDYVVKEGEVIIVDEFTGRLMPGRRYSEGLHQALEAKERLKVANENQTLASITFQNYFRMYSKMGGMTGTADTEAAEFHAIYKLEVMVIPTNRWLIRTEHPDVVYRTESEKFQAVLEEIRELHKPGRPVLVGTISI
jgi:preprotein translocase subunit SecA